ncbi:hypothetical protein ACCT25_25710, partial [Rhizobium ruizarguesonis]
MFLFCAIPDAKPLRTFAGIAPGFYIKAASNAFYDGQYRVGRSRDPKSGFASAHAAIELNQFASASMSSS